MNTDVNHTEISLSAFRATIFWIEDILNAPVPPKGGFRSALASGEILCSLLNAILPGTIKRINHSSNRAAANDNLSLFLLVCEKTYTIPPSRLFSVEDFEDVLLGNEESVLEEKYLKRAEKVAITLFWLAKAVSSQKRFDHLPKLNFEAFSGLLPRNLIHKSFNTGSFRGNDKHIPKHLPESHIDHNSSELEEPVTVQQLQCAPFSNGLTMGSNQSVDSEEKQCVTSELGDTSATVREPQQINNNTFGQDEWQSDLDHWRAKRRQALRMSMTETTSVNNQTEEEQKRTREAIRDRLQMIKNQRALSVTSLFPSIDQITLPVSASPGLTLLTKGRFDLWEQPEDDQKSSVVNHDGVSKPLQRHENVEFAPPKAPIRDNNQDKAELIDALPSETNITEPAVSEHVAFDQELTPSPIQHTASTEQQHDTPRRELTFSLQSKVGASESRWGMMLKSTGPSTTAPFMVDRVKLGSSADLCEIRKDDILVAVNDVDLTGCQPQSAHPVRTLIDLENLLDRLSLDNKRVSVKVQRVHDDSDFSDVDLTEASLPSVRKPDTPESELVDSEPENTAFTDRVVKASDAYGTAPMSPYSSKMVIHYSPTPSLDIPDYYEQDKQNITVSTDPRNDTAQPSTNGLHYPDARLNGTSPTILQKGLSDDVHVQPNECPESPRLPRPTVRKVNVTESEPNYVSLASTVVPNESSRTDYHVIQPIPERQLASSPEEIRANLLYHENQPIHTLPTEDQPLPPPPHTGKTNSSISDIESDREKETFSPTINEQQFIQVRRTDLEKPVEHNRKKQNNYKQTAMPPMPSSLHTPRRKILIEGPNRSSVIKTYEQSPVDKRYSNSRVEYMESSSPLGTSKFDFNRYSYPHHSPPPAPPSPLPTPEIANWYMSTNARGLPSNNLQNMSKHLNFTNPSMVMLSATNYGDEPPPQPPRAPPARQVNPKHKCAACNCELGTGDLMIIGSMSLYYHLACFVCAKCGMALSDGLSNANVRIRHGLLYCDDCYPSKNSHKGSFGQSDSNKQIINKPSNHDQFQNLSNRGSRVNRFSSHVNR